MKQLDLIGDIHGYLDKLKMLLYKLGYNNSKGYFSHSERQAVFVGDYIDRGPDNPGVVNLVRNMVDKGSAIALMGNHEYNAILFNMLGSNGYLRPHSIKNIKQHQTTLLQYQGKQGEYDDMINWFKTLPLFLETPSSRACHACWDKASISFLKKRTTNGVMSDKQFIKSAIKDSKWYNSIEAVCKGIEIGLPKGSSFFDKDGTERTEIRVKWWENPKGKTYKEMSVISDIEMKNKLFDKPMKHYKKSDVPVFFGHYWLKGIPELIKSNVCCLDYSVAKDGYLVAYQFDGEDQLIPSKLVYV